MSSRAIKGPVGKRLMTICSEHVSGRPPGNKDPLRLLSSLFLCARTIRSFLSTSSAKQRRSLRAASTGSLSPFLFRPSFLFLFPSASWLAGAVCVSCAARDSEVQLLPVYHTSLLLTSSSRSADPRIIVPRRLTVSRDPVRPWPRVSSGPLCSREIAFHRSVTIFRICIVERR